MLILNILLHQTATMNNDDIAESKLSKTLNVEALRKTLFKHNRQICITVNDACQGGPTCSI